MIHIMFDQLQTIKDHIPPDKQTDVLKRDYTRLKNEINSLWNVCLEAIRRTDNNAPKKGADLEFDILQRMAIDSFSKE